MKKKNTVKASGVDPIKNKMMNEQRNNGTKSSA